MEQVSWDDLRSRMVADQLQTRGVRDPRVLEAMRRVPREIFAPDEVRDRSYEDRALSVGYGQTISQPYMTGVMLQTLALKGQEHVLEIGTGTGYQAALLGTLAAHVDTVEIVPELAEEAQAHLASLGLTNVRVHLSDGSVGLPGTRKFDAIVVAAGAPDIPPALIDLMSPHSRLLIPLGDRSQQMLTLVQKSGSQVKRQTLGSCSFVPLRGIAGWPPMA